MDLVPIAPIEPCYSTSEAEEDDIRRVFDSSSDSDIEPTKGNEEDDEPMIIVTIPGSGRMSDNEQNEERIVRIIDNEESTSHDPTRRNSQAHVYADREVSESSNSSEETGQN